MAGGSGGNLEPSLRALGGVARYQLLQLLVINLGVWGAAFQLLDNIFIGRIQRGPMHCLFHCLTSS